ncbi:MAG: PAS domain S-box protein, partial [Dehalococcoidia bacterium]|nr:PAS domain S-box protein [Dehalococcoidia bacterium]
RQSEERYRTVLDEMEDSYFEVDVGGHITFTNEATCRNLQLSREELMGASYKTFSAEKSIDDVYKAFNKAYRTGKPVKSFSWEIVRGDGSTGFAETTVLPLHNQDGQIIGFRGIGRDITERKQMEEERKELEQKAQVASRLATVGLLASGVGHEINNPLTAVVGYSQLLMQEDLPEDIKEQLATINEGAQRVASIVKKLLAFARYQKPERTYASINDTVATTLDLLAHQLKTSNIQTNLQLDPDLPPTMVDTGQLQQVFLNLIINAETEMRLAHGKGELSMKTDKVDNTIRISFADNGPGIAEDNLEKIFDPFFTTREVGEGTGLGLSICHEIITEHGGRLYAQSKPGKGATFIVELPVVAEDKHPQAAKPVAEEPAKVAGARVLVVDDEPLILDFVSRVLTDEGHEVETVDNAADALRKIESERYGLILLDIKMPGMSGIELYNHIEKTAQSLARRVVFITGDVMGAETTAFLSRIKAPRIDKPFDAEQLKNEINRILAQGKR